jgi:hypothetical protein
MSPPYFRKECMAFNVAVISHFTDEDGRLSKFQLAEGNGHYYLWDSEIREVVQELEGLEDLMAKPAV